MNILLTTDFTPASDHAIHYAISLLSEYPVKKKYYLLHAFKPMAPYADVGSVPVIQNQAWKKESEQKLGESIHSIDQKYGIKAGPIFTRGGVYEVIHKLEEDKEKDLDLVVIATHEKSLFERITFGANTLQVVEKANTTTLVVPLETEIKKPGKIAFGTDMEPPDINLNSLILLKELIRQYRAELEVIHVVESESEKKSFQDTVLHGYLKDIDHKHKSVFNKNVYDGIMGYIENNQPDMMVVIPRDRNFFEKIFQTNISSKIAYRSKIPLLVLK